MSKVAVIIRTLPGHDSVLAAVIEPKPMRPGMTEERLCELLNKAAARHIAAFKRQFVEFKKAEFVTTIMDPRLFRITLEITEKEVINSDRKVDPDLLHMSVENLDIEPRHRVRAINCLIHGGNIKTIGDLIGKTSAELQKVPNLGPMMIRSIIGALKKIGLELKPTPK